MEGKQMKITKKTALYVILAILALIWIIPMLTLTLTAIKGKKGF